MKGSTGFDITIVKDGKKAVFNMPGYLTPLFAIRDCLNHQGHVGAFIWVSMEDTERFEQLDNCAFFKGYNDWYDGVYLNNDLFDLMGTSTKDIIEPINEKDLMDENIKPEGYLVKKNQVDAIISAFKEIIESYKNEGEIFDYRVECAKKNISLLESITEDKLYVVNPDKSWGDGVFDAFSNAGCERCLIVE
jgi:hypothetical protein